MAEGTFNVARGVFDHPVFAREPFTQREAWLWLIAEAQWKPVRKRVGRVIVPLERGQLAHSERFMAVAWKWERSRVHRFLQVLSAENMVRLKIEPLATRITICNYEDYQLRPAEIEPLANQSRTKLNTEDLPPLVLTEGVLSEIAKQTADKVFAIFGFDLQFVPTRWCGLGAWLDAGIRGGWKPDLILIAARIVVQQRKGVPPGSFHYLQGPINQQHQAPDVQTAPRPPQRQLALVAPITNNGASHGNGTDWKARRDNGHQAYEQLKAYAAVLEARERGGEAGGFVQEPGCERPEGDARGRHSDPAEVSDRDR